MYRFKKYDPLSKDFVKRKAEEKKKDRCLSMKYDMDKSDSQHMLAHNAKIVSYGSGNFEGFPFQDYVCINPINHDKVNSKTLSLVEKKLTHKELIR